LNKLSKKICDFLPLVGDSLRNIDRRCFHDSKGFTCCLGLGSGPTGAPCPKA
jgi:hypothetical protein